jgi:hypothetical protein
MKGMTMTLSEQRRFVTPLAGEDWPALAARVLPDEKVEDAIESLKSWNLHLLARVPPGGFLGADVLFIEPPKHAGSFMLPVPGENNEGA